MLDGANGVGADKMKQINKLLCGLLDITVCNDGDGILNHQVVLTAIGPHDVSYNIKLAIY